MKLVIISDSHEKHRQIKLPEGDVLIHCGDMTNKGSLEKFIDFSTWMKDQDFKHKIIVFGNHEIGFGKEPKKSKTKEICQEYELTLLQESDIIIDGVKFWGSPASPYFYGWEFNYHRGEEISKIWSQIPDDTNVLITHGGPYGILDLVQDDPYSPHERDLHQGCEELNKKVFQLPNLKISCFGHLHNQKIQTVTLNNITFANAAMVDDNHKICHLPIVIDI